MIKVKRKETLISVLKRLGWNHSGIYINLYKKEEFTKKFEVVKVHAEIWVWLKETSQIN